MRSTGGTLPGQLRSPRARCAHAWLVALLALLVGFRAVAQDAHGQSVPPDDGTVGDPLWSDAPARYTPWSVAAGVGGEYARAPLVRVLRVGGVETEVPVLDHVVIFGLGGTVAFHERVAARLLLPVVAGASGTSGQGGPTVGDLTVRVPVSIVLPRADGRGFGLGVVPHLRLPTGDADRLLGDAFVGGGADLIAGLGAGPVAVSASAGVEGRKFRETEGLLAKPLVPLAGSVAVAPIPEVAVHLEGRTTLPIGGGTPPVEALLGVRGAHGSGLFWSAGVSRGLTSGVSAAAFRVLASAGFATGLRPRDTVVPVDEPWRFHVTDPTDSPVADAVIEVGGVDVGRTDAAGDLVLADLRWRDVAVRADGFVTARPDRPEAHDVAVVLAYAPVRFVAWVQSQDGAPLPAAVGVVGEEARVPVGADGRAVLQIPPGTWDVEVSHAGAGRQVRTVVIPPFSRPLETTALLAPEAGPASAAVIVTDADGNPIDNVQIRVDGQPFGTTSTGGDLEIDGLAAGSHDVEVIGEAFQAVELEVGLPTGRTEIPVTLRRQPGSVRVTVRGPDGVVPDATVRFSGPSRLPPVPLGSDGQRIVQLRPGAWSALVLSPSYGVQTRDVVVPAYTTALTDVEVLLQPVEGGAAELLVTVHDPDGRPVDAARVHLDGRGFGATSTGGTLVLPQLAEGPRTLEIAADGFRPIDPIPLFLVRGVQERDVTLDWLPGSIRVIAHTETAEVADAVARFKGPAEVPAVELGPDGAELVRLDAGSWQILAASAKHGLERVAVDVPPDHRSLLVADILFPTGTGGAGTLEVAVRDPDGRPVTGAVVSLDAVVLGTTSSAGTAVLTEVAEGRRLVAAVAPMFREASKPVEVTGEGRVELTLDWAPGAVKVVTRTPDAPVTDATVRFASADDVRSAVRVDASGQRLVALAPGKWQALVSSPSHGLQQRSFAIAPSDGLTTVDFLMEVPAEERTQVLVRVVDPDGNPIPGAEVVLAGTPVGATEVGGALLIDDAASGAVEVRAPAFVTARTEAVEAVPGAQEQLVRLEWVRTPVEITVRDAAGAPVASADVSADGPDDVPPSVTDADGRATLSLRPGKWLVLASSPRLGTLSVPITIAPGEAPQTLVFNLEEARVDVTSTEVVIRERVSFDLDEATLRSESAKVLAEVAATLIAHPRILKVEVQGHTDTTGGAAYNLDLSRRRAEAVVAALVALGVPPERLVAKGYGPTRPLAPNDDEDGRARNRRVQFDIIE